LDVLEPRADASTTRFDGSLPHDDLESTQTDESWALERRSRSKKRRFVRAVAVSEAQRDALQARIVLLEDPHDEPVNQHVESEDPHVESVLRNARLEDPKVLSRGRRTVRG